GCNLRAVPGPMENTVIAPTTSRGKTVVTCRLKGGFGTAAVRAWEKVRAAMAHVCMGHGLTSRVAPVHTHSANADHLASADRTNRSGVVAPAAHAGRWFTMLTRIRELNTASTRNRARPAHRRAWVRGVVRRILFRVLAASSVESGWCR